MNATHPASTMAARRTLPLITLPIIRSSAANAKYTYPIALRFPAPVRNDPDQVSLKRVLRNAPAEGSTFGHSC